MIVTNSKESIPRSRWIDKPATMVAIDLVPILDINVKIKEFSKPLHPGEEKGSSLHSRETRTRNSLHCG